MVLRVGAGAVAPAVAAGAGVSLSTGVALGAALVGDAGAGGNPAQAVRAKNKAMTVSHRILCMFLPIAVEECVPFSFEQGAVGLPAPQGRQVVHGCHDRRWMIDDGR